MSIGKSEMKVYRIACLQPWLILSFIAYFVIIKVSHLHNFLVSDFGILWGVLILFNEYANIRRNEFVLRYMKQWEKITHLSILLMPRNRESIAGIAPLLEKILREYAANASRAIDARDGWPSKNYPFVYPSARYLRKYDALADHAYNEHKKFLNAWDFLVKEGYIPLLAGLNPDKWRKSLSLKVA